jgi:hypothetical protein
LISRFNAQVLDFWLMNDKVHIVINDQRVEHLETIVGRNQLFPEVVPDFINKAVQHGQVRAMILTMAEHLDSDTEFLQLTVELGIQLRPGTPAPPKPEAAMPPPAAPIADANTMHERFQIVHQRILDGNKWMAYLEAYKQLHESVHVLQHQLEAIGQALETARRQPAGRRNLRRVAVSLTRYVDQARKGACSTELPAEHRDWIAQFDGAVKTLQEDSDATDLAPMEEAIEILRALPNRQADLNKELVRCAKSLDRDKLLESIDAALHDLRSNPGTAPEDLLSKLQGFRDNCDRLGPLVQEHDLCQGIDIVLAGIQSLADDAAAKKCRDKHVHADLQYIVESRPDDTLASEAAEAAGRFEATAPKAAHSVTTSEASASAILDGTFRGRFRNTLLEQFPTRPDLEILLDESLSKSLNEIVGEAGLVEVVLAITRWCVVDLVGRLRPLLVQAVKVRPNNAELPTLLRDVDTAIAQTRLTEDRKDLIQFVGDLFLVIDDDLRELTKQIVIEADELAKDLESVNHGIHN